MRSFNRQDYVLRRCEEEMRILKDEHNGIGDKDIHNLEVMMYSIMPRSYWFKRGCISTLRKAIKAMTKKDGCEYCRGCAYTDKPFAVTTQLGTVREVRFNYCPHCGRQIKP